MGERELTVFLPGPHQSDGTIGFRRVRPIISFGLQSIRILVALTLLRSLPQRYGNPDPSHHRELNR
jgi:hypothetical protein